MGLIAYGVIFAVLAVVFGLVAVKSVNMNIKRGMIYTVTTLALFVLYLLVPVSWVFVLPQATPGKTVAIASLSTLLAALLFQPLRDRVAVDRPERGDLQDQEVEGSLEEIGLV
jgi:uncharacterized membrane protein YgdD (TMEM256/DUF423 family)